MGVSRTFALFTHYHYVGDRVFIPCRRLFCCFFSAVTFLHADDNVDGERCEYVLAHIWLVGQKTADTVAVFLSTNPSTALSAFNTHMEPEAGR